MRNWFYRWGILIVTISIGWLPVPGVAGVVESGPVAAAAITGLGDSIFPLEGNQGIDVRHYDLDISWDAESKAIDATATLTIRATEALSRFSLDFHGLVVSEIRVDGVAVEFERPGDKLSIPLPAAMAKGASFEVKVAYHGVPDPIEDSITSGWNLTPEGGVLAVGEPNSSKNWFPSNNHPSDKATYRFRLTVPKGFDAVANGMPGEISDNGVTHSWHYQTREPLASYLAIVTIGHYDRERLIAADGTPVYNYYFKGISAEQKKPFQNLLAMMAFFS